VARPSGLADLPDRRLWRLDLPGVPPGCATGGVEEPTYQWGSSRSRPAVVLVEQTLSNATPKSAATAGAVQDELCLIAFPPRCGAHSLTLLALSNGSCWALRRVRFGYTPTRRQVAGADRDQLSAPRP